MLLIDDARALGWTSECARSIALTRFITRLLAHPLLAARLLARIALGWGFWYLRRR